MTKMRVTHVITDLTAGGAEGMLGRLIAARHDRNGVTHEVISLRTIGSIGTSLQQLGVPVEALGMRSAFDLPRTAVKLARRLRRTNPDVIQTWLYHADLMGGLVGRAMGRRNIVWNVRVTELTREMGVPASTRFVQRACAALSRTLPKRIVYVAHSARRHHEALGYASDRGLVIPNGYAPQPEPDRFKLREELGIDRSAILIGTAGRFTPQKDPKGLISAASGLGTNDPRLHFVFAGRGYDSSNSKLISWIAASPVADRIHLLGERSDMPNVLGGLDIFCLNSLGEGFPNVVAEAMNVGVPCVATDVGDTSYLLDDAGAIVPPRNLKRLSAALRELIDLGPERRRELGELGRKRIAEHFSLDSAVDQYDQLYRALVAR